MVKNREKIILDLCGGTGAWSEPYRKAGYTVHVITLPEFDVTKAGMDPDSDTHILFPYANAKQEGKLLLTGLSIPISRVHGVLAAPPCTMFSVARTTAKTPRDFHEGMRTVEACLKVIWIVQKHGELAWWALENPTGYLRRFLGVPAFRFEQWQYGDIGIKPTDLWGYFNKPTRTQKVKGLLVSNARRASWSHPSIPKSMRHLGTNQARAAIRAITPPGFSRAFFESNK